MAFDMHVSKFLPATPVKEYDEPFCEAMRAVASGRMTVDEAWEWLKVQRAVAKATAKPQ